MEGTNSGLGWRRVIYATGIAVFLLLLVTMLVRASVRNASFILLVDYFLSPQEKAGDARLAALQKTFGGLRDEGGRYQAYADYLESLALGGANSALQRYAASTAALRAARAAALANDVPSAATQYQQAARGGYDPIRLVAALEWAGLLARNGDQTAAGERFEAAAAIPLETIVGFGECSGWHLRGGLIDRMALERNEPVTVVLVWEMPADAAENGDGPSLPSASNLQVYRFGSLVYQVAQTPNLLPDGSFVQARVAGQGVPQGYTQAFMAQVPSETSVVSDPQSPERQSILEFDRGSGHSVGIRSAALPIPTDASPFTYLVAFDYRSSAEAEPRIGLYWSPRGAVGSDDIVSDFVTRSPSTAWSRLVRLYPPRPDAGTVQFLAMETAANSRLYLDNAAMLQVPLACQPEF